jgi:hypothetical protein
VLTVHFDDSGTHLESPVAVCAGWIAPFPQWKKLTREWNKARAEYGFDTFHMAEFVANYNKSEYADKNIWTDRKKRIVLKRLRNIVQSRISQGFAVAVIKKDYDDLVTGTLRSHAGKYHYTYAVRAAIGFIEDWRERSGIQGPIEYIFDRMVKGPEKREVESVFEWAERRSDALSRYGIFRGCHSFQDKRDILPLQAADMLAWLSRREHSFRLGHVNYYEPAAETWNYFILGGRLEAKYQTRQAIMDWVSKNPQPIAPDLPPPRVG